jgi:hypothetical protein
VALRDRRDAPIAVDLLRVQRQSIHSHRPRSDRAPSVPAAFCTLASRLQSPGESPIPTVVRRGRMTGSGRERYGWRRTTLEVWCLGRESALRHSRCEFDNNLCMEHGIVRWLSRVVVLVAAVCAAALLLTNNRVWVYPCIAAAVVMLVFWLYISPSAAISATMDLSPADRLRARHDVRSTLVQSFGGAAVILGLLFTAENVQSTNDPSNLVAKGKSRSGLPEP